MEATKTQKLTQNLKLVEGSFTPSQAAEVIKNLINTKMNYHKLHRLIVLEGNHNDETIFDSSRIKELEAEKNNLSKMIQYALENNKKLKLNGTITVEYTDQ
ncbi:hypothetical protein [Tenacibaculum agarivorans]|uniref:hypothetical protein n=1 Tax=Tenacibaculum agarivorans TaxID=1908389 RepID=UPI00094BA29E|nr:hypothetical protein [Tenacibaculum agarivorans]